MNDTKELLMLGPWVGEFTYEMCWWAPRVRRLCRERYPNHHVVHFGCAGRKVLYADFVDEYVALPSQYTDQIKSPDSGFVRLHDKEGLVDGMCLAGDFLLQWYHGNRHRFHSPSPNHVAPFQLREIVGEGCMGAHDTLDENPWGDFLHLAARPSVLTKVRTMLAVLNPIRPTVAIMAKVRLRHGKLDPENWAPQQWKGFIESMLNDLKVNVVMMALPHQGDTPGGLDAEDLQITANADQLLSLCFDGDDSVEEQIALLKLTDCSFYGSTGAVCLPFFAGTPVFTNQTFRDAWRQNYAWHHRLTNNHEKVKVFSRYPAGQAFYHAPADDIYQSFKQYFETRVRPTPTFEAAWSEFKAACDEASHGKCDAARARAERCILMYPHHADFHHLLGTVCEALDNMKGAMGSYQKALACDSEHRPTVFAVTRLLHRLNQRPLAEKLLSTYIIKFRRDADALAMLEVIRRGEELANSKAGH